MLERTANEHGRTTGAGESARDIKGYGGNENVTKTAKREDGVRPLKLLDDAKQHREQESGYERNAFRKWEAHSFSFLNQRLVRFQETAMRDGEFTLASKCGNTFDTAD